MTRATSSTGNSRRRAAAGFTLLEVLVVSAILALMALAAPMALQSGPPPFEASVRDIAAALRQARSEALRTGAPQAVAFDLRARRYGPTGTEHALAEGLELSVTSAAEARLGQHGAGPARTAAILFFGDGGATGGVLRLSRGDGRARQSATLTVRWLTGAIQREG